MTTEQFATMIRTRPFRPFRIHLADGRNLEVHDPEFIMRSPSGRTAILYKPDETFEIIDLLLVSTLEVLNGTDAPGPSRRKKS